MADLFILSAGAAAGLIEAIRPEFEARQGCTLRGEFGAVGAMKERFLAGAPCDAMISSRTVIDGLASAGHFAAGDVSTLGIVPTAVAFIEDEGAPGAHPAIGDVPALVRALTSASGIYVPDMQRATAGIHMRKSFAGLGILDRIKDRIREFPNGSTAMRAMAESAIPGSIGCTQATEIVATAGVVLAGPLPGDMALETEYCIGVPRRGAQPALAAALIDHLCAPAMAALKRRCGFEPASGSIGPREGKTSA